MIGHLLLPTLLSSFIVTSNQCIATRNAANPSTVSTTTAATSTSSSTTASTTASTTTAVPTACSTCTTDLISIISGNDGDTTPLVATGTDANDCATATYTCQRTPVVDSDVILLTLYTDGTETQNGRSLDGLGTTSAQLTCIDGAWDFEGFEISSVECQIIT
uniref:C6 domain-containing protein n=1 Tax=Caenorhabditis tropicalis TaxID=1561998 RepID=A0A1I7U0G3_9PELO